MKEPQHFELEGIRCDTDGCDFEKRDLNLQEYSEWIGKVCPKCGNVLLSEDDTQMLKFLLGIISIANKIDSEKSKPEKG